jgi:hypothetical protein
MLPPALLLLGGDGPTGLIAMVTAERQQARSHEGRHWPRPARLTAFDVLLFRVQR